MLTCAANDASTEAMLCWAADPFMNDENFFLCMLALEELGATGNKVRGPSCSPSCDKQSQVTGWNFRLGMCGQFP